MLNKKRPYGVVSGVPGVGFEQDGRLFKPNGDPVIVHDPPSSFLAMPDPSPSKIEVQACTAKNDDGAEEKVQKLKKVDYKKHDRRRGPRKQSR